MPERLKKSASGRLQRRQRKHNRELRPSLVIILVKVRRTNKTVVARLCPQSVMVVLMGNHKANTVNRVTWLATHHRQTARCTIRRKDILIRHTGTRVKFTRNNLNRATTRR